MSNGEDVLDNWEEIDEAGLTSTLQKIQAERKKSATTTTTTTPTNNATAVEQSTIQTSTNSNCFSENTNQLQPMKLLQRNPNENANGATAVLQTTTNAGTNESAGVKSPLDDMSATFQPVLMVLHKPTDEYQSANYTQPMQTVKILRRPTQSSDRRNNDLRPKQPIKTLQQREQEYAEARLRILGSAKNPEDDLEQNLVETNSSVASPATPNSYGVTYEMQKTPTVIDTKSPANASTTPTISRTNSTSKMQQHNQQQSPGISLGVIGSSGGAGGGVVGGGVVGNNMPPSPGNLKYQNHYYMQHQLLQQQANYYFQQQQQPQQQQHYQQQIGPVAPVPSLPLPAPSYNNRTMPGGGIPANVANNHRNHHQPPAHLKYQQQKQQQQQQQQYQTWSSPSTATSNIVNATGPMTRTQQQESILRLPRGPDGSVGFQMRR